MKIFSIATAFLFLFSIAHAQLNVGGMVKDKVNKEMNKKKSDDTQNEDQKSSGKNAGEDSSAQKQSEPAAPATVTAYQNYDFRAGDKIIFADNFAADQDGEFPAHWDLTSGQGVINKVTGVPSFLLTDGNYVKVKPLMKTESYLTDNFSVEFDIYPTQGAYGIIVFLENSADENAEIHFAADDVQWSGKTTLTGSLPSAIQGENYYNKWHHVSIAYKNDQLKAYVDQYRPLTVPHCNMKPERLQFGGIGNQDNPIIFKDVKVADGASMNMLDAIYTSGRFVTHGINFDVNSANIKPASMGVIGDVAKFMKDHSDLKLEIDGHTDSDGSDDSNMKLSQQRADAVKAALVQAGIDASRLSTKGFGESKPVASNESPEGKASNRRVEFVKM